MLRSEVVPVWICSAPAATLDELGVAPDSASNFCSSCVTLSVTLIWLLPVAPDATKVMFWPFTVMVSPAANAVLSEFEEVEAAPDSSVAPVMAEAPPVVLRSTWLPVRPLRPSLASVEVDEPTKEMSAVVEVCRLTWPEPLTVAVPPVAWLTAVRTSLIVAVEMSIDRLLPAIEPVLPPPEWNVTVLLLMIR